MLYFELGLREEDYLTDKEMRKFGNFRRYIWKIKAGLGIIVKKKNNDKFVYVIPKVNKTFLKKIDKILKITSEKQVCISNELFYKEEFLNFIKSKSVNVNDGKWIFKYMLKNILDYLEEIKKESFLGKEIAFLVNDNYELAIEYIKMFSEKFKIITIVSNNVKYFVKLENKLLEEYGINLNVVNNYRKSLNKTEYIVNIDFSEKEFKKYTIYNKTTFINLIGNFEITVKNFEGININTCQIAMPNKYIQYIELFKNFDYLNVYESFVRKKTSEKNILKELENDEVEIIFLENENGIIKNDVFLQETKKILDK